MGEIDARFPDRGDYIDAYKLIGDRVRLSARTVRSAFQRRPVTIQTALALAKALGIGVEAFRILADGRGRPKSEGTPEERSRRRASKDAGRELRKALRRHGDAPKCGFFA